VRLGTINKFFLQSPERVRCPNPPESLGFLIMGEYGIAQWERNRRRKEKREKRLAQEKKEKDGNLKNNRRRKKKKNSRKQKNILVRINYKEDLKDFRWAKKRKQIFIRDNYTCQKCKATTNLQVHHKKYINGRRPWQYNEKYLITLCDSCHKKEHLPEIKAKNGNKLLDEGFIRRFSLDK